LADARHPAKSKVSGGGPPPHFNKPGDNFALAEWARQEAAPSDHEIEAVRRLVAACQDALDRLDPDDRGPVEEAIGLLHNTRAGLDTTFPVQFRGAIAPPAPVLFPTVETQARPVR
jgi:hypothetical protein